MNKKKKSTNTSPYPDEVIDRLAWAFYPAILACWNSEEGQREFAAWQAEQAHHANNEKQKVPTGAFLPRGTQSAGHGLFESALLLLHKICAKQKEQHPIRLSLIHIYVYKRQVLAYNSLMVAVMGCMRIRLTGLYTASTTAASTTTTITTRQPHGICHTAPK